MTASLYCSPSSDIDELTAAAAEGVSQKSAAGRRSSADTARSVKADYDDVEVNWCTLTLGRAQRRCRCATSTSTKVLREPTAQPGQELVTDGNTLSF